MCLSQEWTRVGGLFLLFSLLGQAYSLLEEEEEELSLLHGEPPRSRSMHGEEMEADLPWDWVWMGHPCQGPKTGLSSCPRTVPVKSLRASREEESEMVDGWDNYQLEGRKTATWVRGDVAKPDGRLTPEFPQTSSLLTII
ncbi:UNVERIFIED_CONTAM: hypothetical protein K2H54_014267 [Gekko kuhli]